jgi:TRAP-type C4-dicarboxylate transport system permease small subunit
MSHDDANAAGAVPAMAKSVAHVLLVKVPYVIGGILLLAAIAINFANIVGRYVFFTAIYWAEEVLVFIVIWGVFIGAAAITYQGAHLRMDLFSGAIRSPYKQILGGLVAVLTIVAALYAAVQAYWFVLVDVQNGSDSVAADVPMAIPHSALLVGFSLIAFAALVRLGAYISDRFE